MPSTAAESSIVGIYVSNCADRVRITIPLGELFPPCPECGRDVDWILALTMQARASW
jgi:hypothetical protein